MNQFTIKSVMQQVLLALLLFVSAQFTSATEIVTYYVNDALGSPIMALNQAGDVVWQESYQPYGQRQIKSTAASSDEQFYTGKQEEPDIGLQYYGARWYDPDTGRFTSIDPVGVDEGNIHSFNRYAYANNNPYKYVDPDGRSSISVQFRDQKISYNIRGYKGTFPQSVSGGHSGVVAINDKSGLTRYREFGRYNDTGGDVRGSTISNFEMDSNGVPTTESIGLVFSQLQGIGKKAGSSDIEVTFQVGGDFDAMMKEVGKWGNETWHPFGSTCHSFCNSVVKAGGSNGASVTGILGKDNSKLIKGVQNLYSGSKKEE